MLKSMTGFGKAEGEYGNKKYTLEIKSLNSKQIDLNTRVPSIYNEKDMEIRSTISQRLQRGKVYFNLSVENTGESLNYSINKDLAAAYHKELKELQQMIGENIDQTDFLSLLVKMPDVTKAKQDDIDEQEWLEIKKLLNVAIQNLDDFRLNEGAALEKDFRLRIQLIGELLEKVEPFEKTRIDNLKEKFRKSIEEYFDGVETSENRLEQELIYYVEKLDITEEKVRLAKHLEYFIEELDNGKSQGKKLGFICQEIGREINTLGSKANDANLQRIVVQMKDELEKIKEQLMNIL